VKCVICKQGETRSGETTVTFERNGTTVVFKKVPARVCANCGEAYLDDSTSAQLLQTAEEAAHSGVLVDVREFTATPA